MSKIAILKKAQELMKNPNLKSIAEGKELGDFIKAFLDLRNPEIKFGHYTVNGQDVIGLLVKEKDNT